ncbi:hypothetical protein MHK_009136 [Candidatus Magnetomorum sp. HK-1]|nr:hypothetical protein MHK_009136 [Candidatus Magnetomorum sp. HK-1]
MNYNKLSNRIKHFWEKWEYFRNRIHNRFSNEVFAENALSHVLEHVSKNNWKAINTKRQFKTERELSNFLFIVVNNACTDYCRTIYGKKTIPEWIKQLGDIWISVYKKLFFEGESPGDVLDYFKTVFNHSELNAVEEAIHGIISKYKTSGGKENVIDNSETELDNFLKGKQDFIDLEKLEFIKLIIGEGDETPGVFAKRPIMKQIEKYKEITRLSESEHLFVKQIIHSKLTKKKSGEIIGLNKEQSRYLYDKIIKNKENALCKTNLYDEIKKYFTTH